MVPAGRLLSASCHLMVKSSSRFVLELLSWPVLSSSCQHWLRAETTVHCAGTGFFPGPLDSPPHLKVEFLLTPCCCVNQAKLLSLRSLFQWFHCHSEPFRAQVSLCKYWCQGLHPAFLRSLSRAFCDCTKAFLSLPVASSTAKGCICLFMITSYWS